MLRNKSTALAVSGPYSNHGGLVRLAYAATAAASNIAVRGRHDWKRIVLCYHGVLRDEEQKFGEQVRALQGLRGHVLVTFDDAYANLLRAALPAIGRAGLDAVVFAVAGNLGERPRWEMRSNHPDRTERTMSADEIRLLRISGVKIGSHTLTHPRLATLSEDQIRYELTESKRLLERIIGGPVGDLAFPYGSYDDRVIRLAKEAGYRRMYTLDERPVDDEAERTGVYGRFLMSPNVWPIEFKLTCAGAYSWIYSFRRLVRRVRRATGRVLVGSQ